MSEQTDLFDVKVQGASCEELTAEAEASIRRLFDEGHPVVVAFSGGKDSSVVLNLTLTVARRAKEEGLNPVVAVTSSETLVENPEVAIHMRQDHERIRAYAKKHGLNVTTRLVSPSLLSSFQIKTLTGRGLPAWAGMNSDCSTDLKIKPQQSARGKLFEAIKAQGLPEPVTVLGTRFGESDKRDLLMKARGDRFDKATRNKDGDLVLSPIARFTSDDVWEYLGLAGAAMLDSYSDFEETKRIYAAAAGTTCVVVADTILEGGNKKRVGKCGARFGCFTCTQTRDKSLEAMVELEERYAYARGLIRLNKYLRAIQYDWNRRHWVGRTIKAGYVKVAPDTLHPSELRGLTRMILQLDYDERQRALREGCEPMFQIIPLNMFIALDAIQSLNGVARPFACWADLRDIEERGIRYDIPEIEPVKKTPMPAARFLKVGDEWDSSSPNSAFDGLRCAIFEAMTEDAPCFPKMKTLNNGKVVWEVETDDRFEVDLESAYMIEEFERERLLEMHDRGFPAGGITGAYMWYLKYGVLQLSSGHQVQHDLFARRTAFKDRMGLTLDYDINALLAKTVAFSELPPEAAREWSADATTESAATNFLRELDASLADGTGGSEAVAEDEELAFA